MKLDVVDREVWDDGTVVTFLRVPFPVERKPFVTGKQDAAARPAQVPITCMVATQRRVTDVGLKKYARSTRGDLPLIYRQGDRCYIADGHHRVIAAAMRGAHTIRARVVQLGRVLR